MQLLIEEIESLADKFQPNTNAKRIYLGLRDKIINMNLLYKEQEQIEKAYKEGGHHRHVCEANGIDKKCYCRNGNECNFARYITEDDYYQYKYGGGE